MAIYVVTYGTTLDMSLDEYAQICDLLESDTEDKLKEIFSEVSYAEDKRDGEAYSVRFKVESEVDPIPFLPRNISLSHDSYQINIELLEAEQEESIYPDEPIDILFSDFIEKLNRFNVPFNDISEELLYEALLSFQNQIYDGLAVLCRVTIDSCLYYACTRRKDNSSGTTNFKKINPKEFTGKDGKLISEVPWRKLKRAAISQKFMTEQELEELNSHVRELGNFAAHLGERIDREFEEWIIKNSRVLKNFLEEKRKGMQILPKEYPKGYKLRTSRKEAYSALKDTFDFTLLLAARYDKALRDL